MELLGWRAKKSGRLIGSFFQCNALKPCADCFVQTTLQCHETDIRLFGGNFWRRNGGLWFVYQNYSIPQSRILFNYLFKNIFVLCRYAWKRQPLCLNCCWGLPILKKNAISGSLKKTQFLGPNFRRGKKLCPNWRWVSTQFRIFPLIGLNGELPYKNPEKEWFRIGWWRWTETWSCLQFFL